MSERDWLAEWRALPFWHRSKVAYLCHRLGVHRWCGRSVYWGCAVASERFDGSFDA